MHGGLERRITARPGRFERHTLTIGRDAWPPIRTSGQSEGRECPARPTRPITRAVASLSGTYASVPFDDTASCRTVPSEFAPSRRTSSESTAAGPTSASRFIVDPRDEHRVAAPEREVPC